MPGRVQAERNEGIGLRFPERDPAHEPADWYETDADDEFDDPDDPDFDPHPTQRHLTIPDTD